jgi:hypothetical protein
LAHIKHHSFGFGYTKSSLSLTISSQVKKLRQQGSAIAFADAAIDFWPMVTAGLVE